MSNIIQAATDTAGPGYQVIQKPILTTAEAAAMLGMSRQKFRSLNVPRHELSPRIQFYLLDELVEWVRQLPQYGEMPSDQAFEFSTRVVLV